MSTLYEYDNGFGKHSATPFGTGGEPPAPQEPAAPRRRRAPLWITLGILASIGIGSVLVISNRQHIVDQWVVWQFESTATIESYIDRSTMTAHGEFLFKASQPNIATTEEFNLVCANREEGSGVLGCYHTNEKTITLFDVTDPQLDGIEEVVASHEMLHAAWDRMGDDEQARLGTMLEIEYEKRTADEDFVARMELYARTQPGQRLNELHSIVGTEEAELEPELEQYYARYFEDRASLVALHVKSNVVFVALEEQTAALVAELDALRTAIEADYAAYNAGYDQLNTDIEAFNAKADNGGFSSQSQFDRERSALLARQAQLDALFASVQAKTAVFDSKSLELEQLNAQAAALNTAINIVPRSTEPTG
jgi:hypothetical protein